MGTDGRQGGGLPELVDRARTANDIAAVDLFQPIAAHGDTAIDAVTPWLGDKRLGWRATRIITIAGKAGRGEHAVAALERGLYVSVGRVQEHILAAMKDLGYTPPPIPPVDLKYAPSYTEPTTTYHDIVDFIPETGTVWGAIYLTKCGWAYTREAIVVLGGLPDRRLRDHCGHCARRDR
jgi:hypothetical protein